MALLAFGCSVALALGAGDAFAGQLPVPLGKAGSFAALAGSTVTSTGFTMLNGDLGVSPGSSLTGFPPGKVNGTIHATDPTAARAQADLTTAYNDAASRQPPQALPADVGGRTLAPGVYKTGATPALGVTGTLTLDGQGDRNAVFVFRVGSALTTAVNSRVNLIRGAQAGNVFWQIGSSATLGTSSTFAGTILALTSISINSGVTLNGRALARNGAVTLISDTINAPTASGPPPPPPRLHCRSGGRRTGKTHLTPPMAAAAAIVRLRATGAAGANGPDTDGDGLPNSWETKGVDTNGDGKIDLNLRKMGADPCHKDLFVELDAMSGHAIRDAAVMRVVSAFNRAPVSNPDGKPGIHLHVDNGPRSVMNPVTGERWGRLSRSEHRLRHQDLLRVFSPGFDRIKAKHFSLQRRRVFRYGLSIHQFDKAGHTGLARSVPGSDFVVALGRGSGRNDTSVGGVPYQTGVFMHELGHTIGLGHGGGDKVNNKPNYLSVMNYYWTFSGLFRANGTHRLYDYSRYGARSAGTLATLKETSLSERKGLRATGGARRLQGARYCGIGGRMMLTRLNVPIDWNCNGVVSRGRVRAEINNEKPKQTLRPFDDWANLSYAGGSVGVAAATAAQLTGAAASSQPGPPEPTVEEAQRGVRQLTGDFTAPTVRIRGERRVRMPRVARLRVVARDNKEVTDLQVFVDGRERYLTSLDKVRRQLMLRLRFRRGRHTIVAHAVDGAGTSSRVARATVVVR